MSEPISSPHNTRVAAARKLLQTRRRAAVGAFLVEGPHAAGEALGSSRYVVDELFVTPGAADRDMDLLRSAAASGARVTLVTDRVAGTLSDTVTPQGIVAVVRADFHIGLDAVLAGRPLLLAVLVDVADPGNAGTVIRTADAVGADAVILAGDSVDPHNPKCVRASAGSLFHLPVVRAGDVVSTLAALQAAGIRSLATTLDDADDLDSPAIRELLAGPVAWLFGNEAHGLPSSVAGGTDARVRIPIRGAAESLNLAAAAAICLYTSSQAQR